ncbi:MAG: hypothetical protein HGA87_03475 [Desulfobulbaceae bacterium]|nr:hypothetical protein [Desulfobulbaceae bacterium]
MKNTIYHNETSEVKTEPADHVSAYISHRNAMACFLAKRKGQLDGRERYKTIKTLLKAGTNERINSYAPMIEVESYKRLNPYDSVQKESAHILQTLSFLEKNGLKRIAFKTTEGESAFIARADKIKKALMERGLKPTLKNEEDFNVMATEHPPYHMPFDLRKPQDRKQLLTAWMDDLDVNHKAQEIIEGPQTNLEQAIKYINEIVHAAKSLGFKDDFHRLKSRIELIAKLQNLDKQVIKDIGFALDEEEFADFDWLSKRVKIVEKALTEDTPVPPADLPAPDLQTQHSQSCTILELCDLFPTLTNTEVLPKLPSFICKASAFGVGIIDISVRDGSHVVFDLTGKKAYPFYTPQSRNGNAEALASILINNIGWTESPETGEWCCWAASLIEKPRKCSNDGPTSDDIRALLSQAMPTRPNEKDISSTGSVSNYG